MTTTSAQDPVPGGSTVAAAPPPFDPELAAAVEVLAGHVSGC